MTDKILNANLTGTLATVEIMNGVFYDPDLDTSKNHLSTGHKLTLTYTQKLS